MPRGSRKRRNNKGRRRAFLFIPLAALLLSLAWVWKANRVKEYYSRMKELEEVKKKLGLDNARLFTEVSRLKSLKTIDKVVTGRLKLTQDVNGRMVLEDPVKMPRRDKAVDFVDMDKVTDWLEDAAVKSGKALAGDKSSGK